MTPNLTIHQVTCPLCGSRALHDLGTLGFRNLAACRNCRHRFVSFVSEVDLENEYRAAYYSEPDDPRIRSFAAAHAPVWDAVLDQVLALNPDAQSLLDIGAGTGGLLHRARTRRPGMQLFAIEPISAARTALLRSLPDVMLAADSAEALGDSPLTFDVITMLQTLEHVRDPMTACRGILQSLRPHGLLFLALPNRHSFSTFRHGRQADVYANGTHLHFFDARTLTRMLREVGFERIERIVTFGGGQYSGLPLRLLQYAGRWLGWGSELRLVARRPG